MHPPLRATRRFIPSAVGPDSGATTATVRVGEEFALARGIACLTLEKRNRVMANGKGQQQHMCLFIQLCTAVLGLIKMEEMVSANNLFCTSNALALFGFFSRKFSDHLIGQMLMGFLESRAPPPGRPASRGALRPGGRTLAHLGFPAVAAWRRRRSEERGLCPADAARRGDETGEEEQRIAGGAVRCGAGELGSRVGPRNLRKLVDKGFNGVAQLKGVVAGGRRPAAGKVRPD
ncbi:hypothetical protein GUJ93_ZPchr0007g6252 [Zizania palustris]|uniref:Uncharacterized protein n=1 Tax=Zizania palustris TaxID=103762 RepID=A0A8J5T1T4_ZIZPA|nr:hypothetical protein GUJ93_ZPchr0007g6252 [Zizania palustris]